MRTDGSKTTVVVAVAALALSGFGCGGMSEEGSEYRVALPLAGEVELDVPPIVEPSGSATSEDGINSTEQALIGQPAVFAVLTAAVATEINVKLAVGLSLLRRVTAFPPSAVEDDKAIWGPWTPPLGKATYVLVVRTIAPFAHEYQLLARPAEDVDGEFTPVVWGDAQLGDGGRTGHVAVNATKLHELNPVAHPDTGGVRAEYDTTGAQRQVNVHFVDFSNNGQPEADALYHFLRRGDGSGEFAFMAEQDLQGDGSAAEKYAVVSKWRSDHAGRSNASVSGGDLPDGMEITVTECWNSRVRRVFYQGLIIREGDPNLCVF